MIRGELPSRPDNRLPARVEPAGGWEVIYAPTLSALMLALRAATEEQHPIVQTIYITEYVSSVRVLLPDGRTETITELRE